MPRPSAKQLLLALALLSLMVVLHIWTAPTTAAISTRYFDDDGASCDVSACDSTEVRLMVGETRFIRRTGVNLAAYFNGPSGQITINNGHFCNGSNNDEIQSGDWFDGRALTNGTNIARYVVAGQTQYGKKYASGSTNCDNVITFNVSNLPYDAGSQKYRALIEANYIDIRAGEFDGLKNLFSVSQTGGSPYAISHKGGSSGYEVTVQETAGANNINYLVRFGSDCSVTSNQVHRLYYYDMDNDGGSGAQLGGKVTMELYDDTDNQVIKTWTPATNSNQSDSVTFTAEPNHNYIWRIKNVYKNNTIQFSTPFDGIHYTTSCVPPDQLPTGTAVFSCGPPTITGNATDANRSTQPLRIQARRDAPGGPTVEVASATNRTFSINAANAPLNADDFASHRFYIYAQNINSSGATVASNPWVLIAITAPNTCPPPVSCGGSATIPALVTAGTNTSATVTVTYPTVITVPSQPTYKMTVTVQKQGSSAPPTFNSTDVPYSATTQNANATVTFTPTETGTYVISWTFAGDGNCSESFTVAEQPYLNVYRGDVQAGSDFDTGDGCTLSATPANIWAFNQNSGSYFGAGTQLAVSAYGSINQFASRNQIASGLPKALSFANTNPAAPYGGNSEKKSCIRDYWSAVTAGRAPSSSGMTIDLTAAPAAGSPLADALSGLAITLGSPGSITLGPGAKTDIFVDGDVYLNANVRYDTTVSWANQNQIPSFRLIVRGGNIYIGAGVTQLDGVYIALPNGVAGKGKVFTCAGGAVAPSTAFILASCGTSRLTVNGAVIAKQLKLLRTIDAINDATAITEASPATSRAAEIFNYTPEAWLAIPEYPEFDTTDLDAISNLPALL